MPFKQYIETLDPVLMHAGENAPHAYFIPFDADQDARGARESSCRFTLLNGQWEFKYYPSVRDFTADLDPMTEPLEASMPVPGTWQMNGYDHIQYTNVRFPFPYDPPYVPADNPCGLYRRRFALDKQPGAVYQLVFEGVDSCLLLWVNGQFIGASQVPHSPAEYDVTAALVDGENTVCALVTKWSAGSYCEDQDKFRYSGIFRDVYLLRRDAGHVVDFSVRTALAEDLHQAAVQVRAAFSQPDCACQCELYAPDGTLLATRAMQDGACAFELNRPLLWTAETPVLYTLLLRCGGEEIAQRVGVRKIEIRNEVVLLNGSPVRFRGVNLHESSCDTGAYTPPEHIRRDLLMMKAHNINAVRTSHYPQPPLFYQLCDELGIYVLDEADLECHGVVSTGGGTDHEKYNRMADDPAFGPMMLDRVQRMAIRDQNSACVVIYSMGNEAGMGVNFDRALAWTKRFDPTRLTHYERASFPPEGRDINRSDLDLYSRMYPSLEEIERYFSEHTVCKPYIMCEYCHAMGNGPGDLENYFRLMEREERICGAFVWEWCDHAPAIGKDKQGRQRYRYGGDFGEVLHDGNFCADGLVSSDRTPHPGLLEYKNVLRPLRVAAADLANGWITLKNHLDFVSPKGRIDIKIVLSGGGQPEETVLVPAEELDIAPRGTATLHVPARAGGCCTLYALSAADTPWGKRGDVLGMEQVGEPEFVPQIQQRAAQTLRVSGEKERYVTICGDDFVYRYDSMTGAFAAMAVRAKEMLLAPMAYNIWRAPTDNDRNIKNEWNRYLYRYAVSRGMGTQVQKHDDRVEIETAVHISSMSICLLAQGTVRWTVFADGRVACQADMRREAGVPVFPRLGLRMMLPADYDKLRYFAYGPLESYIDKRQASLLGWHVDTVETQYAHPLRPQESGSHYGARSLTLHGAQGALRIEGAGFGFSALNYSHEQLADVAHDDELTREERCVLCLDMAQRGIGSNSCGPELPACYEIADHIQWQVMLDPLAE